MITKYENFCAICGTTKNVRTHHCIFGRGLRELADTDSLTLPVCDTCHNMGRDSIHGNSVSEKLSKILGQEHYISQWLIKEFDLPSDTRDMAIESFRKRYGRSYV